ncbi:MAG: hypothetical protein JST82_04570 [Bacteroidetes bacterium]|nr:hypothetical protein [Bacteroidota bacterium]
MKKIMQYGVVLCTCILLWGCPYESTVPIDQPSVKIDTRLLGKWKSKSDKNNNAFVFTKLDEYRYKLTPIDKKTEPSTYTVWISNVNGFNFLNMQEDQTGKFTFIVPDNITTKSFTYKVISDANKTPFTNSEELKNWITYNMMNLSFFEEGDTLVRIK